MTTAAYKLNDGESFYRVFEVDRVGKELEDKDDGRLVSDLLLKEVKDGITDVVIASHGWNTSQLVRKRKFPRNSYFGVRFFSHLSNNEYNFCEIYLLLCVSYH